MAAFLLKRPPLSVPPPTRLHSIRLSPSLRRSTDGTGGLIVASWQALASQPLTRRSTSRSSVLLPRLADQRYWVDQARLYSDMNGPEPARGGSSFGGSLAAVRRHHLSGSVAFTTTVCDDRAFLAAIAGSYAKAAAHTTLSTDWTTSRRPGRAG